jgi:hypothetical protein
MDLVGRKMYVLGDGLAEMYDLDTKAYTNLAGQPWASRFITRGLQGPGVAWHERTRQIVAWMQDGNSVDVINPATGTRISVPMGGVTVSTPPDAGTYGRFRMLPGTDQVVLVNYDRVWATENKDRLISAWRNGGAATVRSWDWVPRIETSRSSMVMAGIKHAPCQVTGECLTA